MTCIIGLRTKEGIFIGGDSAAAEGWNIYATALKKVFLYRSSRFLIGYTSSFRMGQLLQYKLKMAAQGEQGDLEYMVTVFVDAVRQCFKEGGFAKVENSQEEGGEFLVGYKDNLYVIYSDFQVNVSRDDYFAVGCGAHYAKGSMWATQQQEPEARIINALEAASHFSNGVCPPYYVEILRPR